ncbi:tRNA (N(6)-L-threonylcarbamoyladenosine(37)-C(2))-methylthiotransferase MtaB [bacterium]|nr:MAG: tRNA (N(6)-L-threonylcarbamoyladenosine(37)-C(2))-methylthiotransferase MtaB [bacterium]
MKRVAFYTLGCKLNFSETSTLKRSFTEHEFEITSFENEADVYVINTCSVTQDANKDCRKVVRRAQKSNPNAFIAVVGCYAQLEPEEIAQIEGVDLVLGAKEKFEIFDLVPSFEKVNKTIIHRSDVNEAVDFHHAFSSNDRTRAFLKVQDGCDYKCSFCTIPLARGKSRSPLLSEVVENARRVVDHGYQEVVVTGVNAGDFGKGNDETFLELMSALNEIEGLNRIRVSSIEPNLLNEDIIRLAASSTKIQPHFHMPLQSGSDEMLKTMRRRYRSDLYHERVSLIKELMPHACIGVDVITGHPGETDELFQESFDFIQSLPVSYLHVFTYSERPNTHALEIQPSIEIPVRKKRTHLLRRLSAKKRFEFDQHHIESIRPTLFEEEEKDGLMFGWTDNYIRVAHPYMDHLVNTIVPVQLKNYRDDVYHGTIGIEQLVSL